MRLLHVSPSFYPAHLYGGPVVSLHRLAVTQVQAGHQVRVLTSDANGPGRRLPGVGGRWVQEHGVPTYYARALVRQDYSAEIAWKLPALVRWAELVHVTAVFSPTSVLALAAAGAIGRPVVLSPRGSLLPWALAAGGVPKRAALALLTPLLRRVAGWHATSDDEAEALRQLGVVSPGAALAVVENGVDPIDLPERMAASNPPRVTMLGRIDPVKGIDLALAAFELLGREHPEVELVLAGPDRDGHLATYQREAARRRLRVCFVGLVRGPDKTALLAGSSVLWLCSRMESFGNVVLEALAAGTPVVAVRSTPWRWLEEAEVGRWVEPDAAAVCAATAELLRLQQDPEARATLRRRCREAVTTRFAWPEIARRMDVLYAQARRIR
ncbi:MAG: glycosyltransferase [Myxococcales bacterium]|nr:glycosyltransferase [Myxococcota bacterium]MDW8280758.1 glycosyltransferase [Myxococcales bacterium]